jgi:hypothetical protein
VNREQLAHVLRAAARITEGAEIIVIGSQAILGSYDADHLPARVTLSIEADLAFRDDPNETKSDKVDGAIGELSAFHDTFGYYGQGVSVTTAILPAGWRERLVRFDREDAAPAVAWCLESHDLVVSKLVAGRQKDVEFAEALISVGLVDVVLLEQRARRLNAPRAVIDRVLTSVERCVRRVGMPPGAM